MNDLDLLDPEARAKYEAASSNMDNDSVSHTHTSTRRTVDEQIAYYAQGRTTIDLVNLLRQKAGLPKLPAVENTYTVTNCDGINTLSNHQSGKAIDVVPVEGGRAVWPPPTDSRWGKIAVYMEGQGFKWGGRWKNIDLPHYELV